MNSTHTMQNQQQRNLALCLVCVPGCLILQHCPGIQFNLHKWGCGTSTNSVYYRISVHITQFLVGVVVQDRLKVGVVAQTFVWSVENFVYALHASCYLLLCLGLSSHELGNYDQNYLINCYSGCNNYDPNIAWLKVCRYNKTLEY